MFLTDEEKRRREEDTKRFMRAQTAKAEAQGRPTGTAAALNGLTERMIKLEEKHDKISLTLTELKRQAENALTKEDGEELERLLTWIQKALDGILNGQRPEPNQALAELTARVEALEDWRRQAQGQGSGPWPRR